MKLVFHTPTRNYEAYSSFSKLQKQLPKNFIRCHKSFIANINNIDKHQYLPFIAYKKDKNKWDENHNKLNEFRTISISSIKDNYVYQYYNELLSKLFKISCLE